MDPNETLRELRELADKVAAQDMDVYSDPEDRADAARAGDLAAGVQALDEWLSRGGFLPDAWERESESGDFSERDWRR